MLRWQGQVDKAVRVIDKFLFERPKELSLLQEKSDAYRYALRDYPNDISFLFSYTQFLYDKYDFKNAAKVLKKIKSEDVDYAISLLKMRIMVQWDKYELAKGAFQWSNLSEVETNHAYYYLGNALLKKKQNELAVENFKKVSDKSDFSLQAALKIGEIKYANDLQSGNEWFEEIQAKHQLNKDVLLREKAFAMKESGKAKEALVLFNRFLEDNPKNEDVRYARAMLFSDMQLESAAIEDLKRLHALLPESADLQNSLGYTLLSQSEKIDYASQLIKKSLFSGPYSHAVVDSMGWAKYRAKKYEEALSYFRYVYGQYLDGEVVGHYIMALWASGQRKLAKKIYKLEMKYWQNIKKIKQITSDVEKGLSQ